MTAPHPTELGPEPLTALPPPDEATIARLHRRLENDAVDEGLLDVAYRTLDTPVGTLLLAATEAGLVRVAYEQEDHDAVLAALAARISPRVLRAPARLDAVAAEIEEYFSGRRQRFTTPLDMRLTLAPFRRSVLTQLQQIGYGTTASYATVAAAAGNAKAVRAVGTACASNPLPVVVPCHRVVRSDGNIGQYLGGAAAKRTLLDLESAGAPAA